MLNFNIHVQTVESATRGKFRMTQRPRDFVMGQHNANPPMASSYLETSTRVCLAFLQSGPLVKIKAKQAADVTLVESKRVNGATFDSNLTRLSGTRQKTSKKIERRILPFKFIFLPPRSLFILLLSRGNFAFFDDDIIVEIVKRKY